MDKYTSFDQLPAILRAEDIAKILRVSLGNAYNIMHSKGFPKMQIGSRLMVPKDKFLAWVDAQSGGAFSPKK